MKLVRFDADGRDRFGIARDDEQLVDLSAELPDLAALATLCLDPPAGMQAINQMADRAPKFSREDAARSIPLDGCFRIFCIALNYQEHAAEASLTTPDEPLVFLKLPSTLLPPDADIARPPLTETLDYEGELAAVIGRGGSDIDESDALDSVLGYTVLNDVTARDLQRRQVGPRTVTDWFSAKALDATTPVGPYVVTADEVDASDLKLVTRLNGKVMQEARTSQMVTSIPRIISYLSRRVGLKLFDVIATGTPAGIGKTTGTWLEPGDVVEVEIEGIGQLSNRITAATKGRSG